MLVPVAVEAGESGRLDHDWSALVEDDRVQLAGLSVGCLDQSIGPEVHSHLLGRGCEHHAQRLQRLLVELLVVLELDLETNNRCDS